MQIITLQSKCIKTQKARFRGQKNIYRKYDEITAYIGNMTKELHISTLWKPFTTAEAEETHRTHFFKLSPQMCRSARVFCNMSFELCLTSIKRCTYVCMYSELC